MSRSRKIALYLYYIPAFPLTIALSVVEGVAGWLARFLVDTEYRIMGVPTNAELETASNEDEVIYLTPEGVHKAIQGYLRTSAEILARYEQSAQSAHEYTAETPLELIQPIGIRLDKKETLN